MRFDRNGTNLIVADAFFGLLEVNPETKAVKTLLPPTPGFNGKPFRFANHLDIDEDGTIYFTHSSTKWQRHQAPYSFFEGDKTGRLMAYHPKTEKMELLMDGLYFANGVQISPEGDHLLVVEYAASRIMKYVYEEFCTLSHLLVRVYTMIGQFSMPYFTVSPAKFK